MKRGLKDEGPRASAARRSFVEEYSPMKRGLKVPLLLIFRVHRPASIQRLLPRHLAFVPNFVPALKQAGTNPGKVPGTAVQVLQAIRSPLLIGSAVPELCPL